MSSRDDPHRPPTRKWEVVIDGYYDSDPVELERCQVPGGWLYRAFGDDGNVALCFVPRPPKAEKG